MQQDRSESRRDWMAAAACAPTRPEVSHLAGVIAARHPGSTVLLYGSGASVLQNAEPTTVLFDFYVIAPSYRAAFNNPLLRFAAWLLPPNVFYLEQDTPFGRLRAKYAVLSIDHFEELVSRRTFHSYFWARFAQPFRIVKGPEPAMTRRIITAAGTAVDTFVHQSAGLVDARVDVADLWRAGLAQSYQAELRAEPPDRVDALLAIYGDWPERVTIQTVAGGRARRSTIAWRLRRVQGGALSVARLLKGLATFQGGVDYILWKIERHAGIALSPRRWERAVPVLGLFSLAARFFRARRAARRD